MSLRAKRPVPQGYKFILSILNWKQLFDGKILSVLNIKSVGMFEYELVGIGMVLYVRTLWVRLIYVETYMNIQGYVGLHCNMLGYAVVFWACFVLVCFDILGCVWICFGKFEYVNI